MVCARFSFRDDIGKFTEGEPQNFPRFPIDFKDAPLDQIKRGMKFVMVSYRCFLHFAEYRLFCIHTFFAYFALGVQLGRQRIEIVHVYALLSELLLGRTLPCFMRSSFQRSKVDFNE